MRDDSYLDGAVAAKSAARPGLRAATTALGALMSLGLVAGIVLWSYRLGVRDAAEIPVIRAETGLMRIRPEEPGGSEVAHQDRAVYDVVTEGGAAPAEAPAPGLAPPPASLREEDRAPAAPAPAPRPTAEAAPATAPGTDPATDPAAPAVEGAPAPAPAGTVEVAAPAEGPEGATGEGGEAAGPADLASAVEAALAEALAETPPSPEPLAEGQAAGEAAGEAAGDGAPRYSPSAPPRPAKAAEVAATVDPAVAAAAVTASPVQIQLGAFESEEVAAREWAAISGKNADLIGGRGRAITPVQSGGRRLWRLRTGPFESVADAAALCRGLSARGQDCIVARAR